MTKTEWDIVKDIFADTLDQPTESRDAYLRERCGSDENLFREVSSLLASSSEDNLLEKNSIDLASRLIETEVSYSERLFGNYRIIREIGSGGMGAVFLAERDDGEFKMQAALKIVRQSIADREIISRFKRERQILADLHHPNIAVLHDGGLSDKGEPYLAMEYIDGQTLIDHARTKGLSIPERLRLFLKICSAVTYAHQNLIVHRDIKPSNILVGSDGEPKLLDFGLAKAFAADDSEDLTTLRAFTPAYASPEQIAGKNITTASDIYSLGVILYELLTGSKPHDLDDKSYEEILHTISVNEPRSPSQISNAKSRSLNGDLDNITLMALRKEPERRYRSVEELAADIQNHLEGRPVSARQNTFRYLAGKFVSRNKIAVTAAALVLIFLVTGLGISMWQAAIARRESERSNAVNQFLKKILQTALPGSGLGGKSGEEATIADVLNEVEKRLDDDLFSEPEVRADLRQLLGEVYLSQGRYEEAGRNIKRALEDQSAIFGRSSPKTLKSELGLATLYVNQADYDRGYEIFDRRFPELAGQFEAGQIEADFYLPKVADFAMLCRARGDAVRAEKLLHSLIADATKIGMIRQAEAATNLLTLILLDQGRFDEAEAAQIKTLSEVKASLPSDNPLVGSAMTLLGSIQMENGELQTARENLIAAETIYRKNYGPDYMPLYDNIRLQAQVAYLAGDYPLARKQIETALLNYRKISSPKYINFASALTIQGLTLNKLGMTNEAVEILTEAVRIRSENLPPAHFMTALTKGALGECLTSQKDFAGAEPLLLDSLENLIASQGPQNPRVALAKTRIATLYQQWQKPELAAKYSN